MGERVKKVNSCFEKKKKTTQIIPRAFLLLMETLLQKKVRLFKGSREKER